jgi:hypothetical protein
MLKRSVLILLLFLSIIFTTCEDSVSTNNEVLNPIVPLEIGNAWSHRIEWFDSTGNLTQTFYDSSAIISDTIIQNERWFIWSNIARTITTNRKSGYWYRFGNTSYLVLKYPIKKGETYKYGNDPNIYLDVTVLAIDSVISVPAGDFSCIIYEWRNSYGPLSSIECYAPNIGMVRYERYSSTSYGYEYMDSRFDLSDIKIKKK